MTSRSRHPHGLLLVCDGLAAARAARRACESLALRARVHVTVADACAVLDGGVPAAIVVVALAQTSELAAASASGHDVVLVAGRELEADEIAAAVSSGAAAVIAFTVEQALGSALARAIAHLTGA